MHGELYSEIGKGFLVFLGVEKNDSVENAEKLAQKIVNLRIFGDGNNKMKFSLLDINGEILIVSQFTLCADCQKGTCPSFDDAAPCDKAIDLYEYFIKCIRQYGIMPQTGKFRAMMDIELINEGPVTLFMEK